MYKKYAILLFFVLIFLPCTTSSKIRLPSSPGANGILVVPQSAKGGFGSGFTYFYILSYTPETKAKIEVIPDRSKNFVIIKDFPPGRYYIQEITIIPNPIMRRAYSEKKTRRIRPMAFSISPGKITILDRKVNTEVKEVEAEYFRQSWKLENLNATEMETIVEEIKKLKNFASWELNTASKGIQESVAQSRPKVLMIPREGNSADIQLMLEKEVMVMKSLLTIAGFNVEVATASGNTIVSPSLKLTPDLKLVDVKMDEYAGFIMPCMAVGGIPGPPIAPEAVEIVKHAVDEGKPVAAQFGSIIILARAGVLKGKKYAFFTDPLKPTRHRKHTDPNFEGAIYSGSGVVQDGNIITSGVCPMINKVSGFPDGTTKLTELFIAELKK